MQIVAAAERNKTPIGDLLSELLQAEDQVLEVASGTGQHAAYFATRFPQMNFYPTEIDAEQVVNLTQHLQSQTNVMPARRLDVCDLETWGESRRFNAVLVANLFHISPWQTVGGFFSGAAAVLGPGGFAHVYGPFKRQGQHTSQGNEAFDLSLRQRNPEWGIRNLEEVVAVAEAAGFTLCRVHQQPANNLSVVLLLQ